jgi:hypothetical protein
VHPNPYRYLHAFFLPQARLELCGDRLENAGASVHRPRGIVFVRHRPAKVHQQAVAQILGNGALVLLNDRRGGGLIGADHLAQVFGIEPLRQRGRVGQITEHDSQLTPFGFEGTLGRRWHDWELVLCAIFGNH